MIVRHAESEANHQGVLAGRIDPTPLTKRGEFTAQSLQSTLQLFDPHVVFSSPMLRCRQTATLAGSVDFILDDRLIEMNYGKWNGRKLKSLARRREWNSIQRAPESFQFPEGESFTSAADRIRDFVDSVRKSAFERVALFTHGDIARIMINQMMGRELRDFQRIMIEPASHSLLIADRKNPASPVTISYLNRVANPMGTGRTDFKVGGE